jgi:hypothetical protein
VEEEKYLFNSFSVLLLDKAAHKAYTAFHEKTRRSDGVSLSSFKITQNEAATYMPMRVKQTKTERNSEVIDK